MKLKIILSVLLLFSLLKVDANPLVDISITSGKEEVFLHSNDIPFEILTTGKEDGSRSVIPLVASIFCSMSSYSNLLNSDAKVDGIFQADTFNY